MAKMHELLAVDANLKGQAQKTRLELQSTMEKKRHLFSEKLVTFTPLAEGDVKIGTIQELEWSSLITPALKAELLERSEAMYRAVTQARSRANEMEVDTKAHRIGKKRLDHVFQPLGLKVG